VGRRAPRNGHRGRKRPLGPGAHQRGQQRARLDRPRGWAASTYIAISVRPTAMRKPLRRAHLVVVSPRHRPQPAHRQRPRSPSRRDGPMHPTRVRALPRFLRQIGAPSAAAGEAPERRIRRPTRRGPRPAPTDGGRRASGRSARRIQRAGDRDRRAVPPRQSGLPSRRLIPCPWRGRRPAKGRVRRVMSPGGGTPDGAS
jgi:hypothetical protein